MAPDPDADLRARVAELEQRVAQQQETIQSLLPGRRGVLKGAALLGGGALVGAGTADRASAQASGQVGTSSDPVDVEAYDLAVQNQLSSNVDAGGNDLTNLGSVNTGEVGNGGSPVETVDPLAIDETGNLTSGQRVVREFGSGSNASGFDEIYARRSVSTSGTTIITNAVITVGGPFIVHGRNGSDQFIDVITGQRSGPVTTQYSEDRGAAARNYAVVNTEDIELSMGSGSYDVVATGPRFNLS